MIAGKIYRWQYRLGFLFYLPQYGVFMPCGNPNTIYKKPHIGTRRVGEMSRLMLINNL